MAKLLALLILLIHQVVLIKPDGDFTFPDDNSLKETSESRNHYKRRGHNHHQFGGYPSQGPYAGNYLPGGGGCWHIVNPDHSSPHARTFGLFELFDNGYGGGHPPLHDDIPQGPSPLPPVYIQCNTVAGGVAPLAPVGPPIGPPPHPGGGLLANHPILAQHLGGGQGGLLGGPGPGGLLGSHGPGGLLGNPGPGGLLGNHGPGGLLGGYGPGGLLGGGLLGQGPLGGSASVAQALTNVLTDKRTINKFWRQINRNIIRPLNRLFR